ncbi:MAG: helix-turn-helix domain-containing protein [Patescibacteria group bacterium]
MTNSDKIDNELPEFLTLKEACKILKCHPNTLRQWDKKGVLVAIRIGVRKDRRYQKNDIIKMLSKK